MYKITWDTETGGVLLHSRIVEGTLGTSPRPVFWEELDLLKLNELGWEYPHCEEPLLWAVNKQYYYRGTLVFEAKGANIYDSATVVFAPGQERLKLKPVNVKKMLEKTHEFMFLLESEAIEFIHETYSQYAGARKTAAAAAANQMDFEALAKRMEAKRKQKMAIVKEDCDSFDVMPLEEAEQQGKKVYQTTKIDRFLASFSGGKDSQVVLDLCTRAIPSTEFAVIYSDTGYELPPSLSLYEEVQRHYGELYPDLKFSIAKNHEEVIKYWEKIGPPSDNHRWCCAIMKTAPLYRLLKLDDNKQAKVLTFDGVRAEESTRRSGYNRIGKGVKHDTVINARPILYWSQVEIFLYLFDHQLPINPAYRQGMSRVGCVICPFGSEWNEMVVKQRYEEPLKPFLEKIEHYAKKSGVQDVEDYVRQGGWKRRASGNNLDRQSHVDFKSTMPSFKAIVTNPAVPIESFLTAIGKLSLSKSGKKTKGEIKYKDAIHTFTITETKENVFSFQVDNITDPVLVGYIRKCLYKCTYCIHCETCEVECPTGALRVFPDVYINDKKCVHCKKCLDFHEKGCIAANSLYISLGGNMTKLANIDRYKNFGFREEWLENYLIDLDDYWTSNHGLNETYQIPALKCWLKDAEIIDDKNNVTELGKTLASIREDNPDLVWEIVWINLCYNSFIVNWFAKNIKRDATYSAKLMEELIGDQYSGYKAKTIHNAVYQLMRTLKESPVGSVFGQLDPETKDTFIRRAHDELSEEAVAYSLYKYSSAKQITSLRVADFYRDDSSAGPAIEFAISRAAFERSLRSLNSSANRVLVAELNMGLDSITMRGDLTPLGYLQSLV